MKYHIFANSGYNALSLELQKDNVCVRLNESTTVVKLETFKKDIEAWLKLVERKRK